MEAIYLLTQDYEFHDTISKRKAINLMFRPHSVEVIKYTDIEIAEGIYLPKVLRLVKSIRKYYGKKVNWSPDNLFTRDENICQYCHVVFNKNDLTVDHVLPRSRGGKTEWENCVTACKDCNNLKDDKTPQEAKMFLRRQPYAPTIMEFFKRKIKLLGVEKTLKELGIY